MANRKYSIDLIVHQQTSPPPPPPPPPAPNTPAPPGSPASLEGLTKYVTSVYAIRQAWSQAKSAIDAYVESNEKLSQAQKTAAEKFLDFERGKRAYMFAAGGLDPAKRAVAAQDLEKFSASHPFQSPQHALTFAERWQSDVAQYATGATPLIDETGEKNLRGWLADFSTKTGIPEKEANKGASAIVGSTNWLKRYGKDKAALAALTKFVRSSEILAGGRGDPKTNWDTLSKLINQNVSVNQEEGRESGDDAIEHLAVSARNVAEFSPEQAETYERNRRKMLRNFKSPTTAKVLKAAGIGYESAEEAEAKLTSYYRQRKADGKLPPGMTFSDFVANVMKGDIRGSISAQASHNAKAVGASEASLKKAMETNPDNVLDKIAAGTADDAPGPVDKARQSTASEFRNLGKNTTSLELAKEGALNWFLAKGYGVSSTDMRSPMERGAYRNLNPGSWRGGTWEDFSEKDMTSDYANMMLYREVVNRNRPRATAYDNEKQVDDFYRSDKYTRERMLTGEMQKFEADGKSVPALLKELIELEKRNQAVKPGVPQVPQAPGMVQ